VLNHLNNRDFHSLPTWLSHAHNHSFSCMGSKCLSTHTKISHIWSCLTSELTSIVSFGGFPSTRFRVRFPCRPCLFEQLVVFLPFFHKFLMFDNKCFSSHDTNEGRIKNYILRKMNPRDSSSAFASSSIVVVVTIVICIPIGVVSSSRLISAKTAWEGRPKV